jgi:hypothetical protein
MQQLAQLPYAINQTSFVRPSSILQMAKVLDYKFYHYCECIIAKSTRSSNTNMVQQNGDALTVLRNSCT